MHFLWNVFILTLFLCVYVCVCKIFERILFIWAIRHPASGYVQGINDLVTPFFVVYVFEYIGKFHLPELVCSVLLMRQSAFLLQELLSSARSWTFLPVVIYWPPSLASCKEYQPLGPSVFSQLSGQWTLGAALYLICFPFSLFFLLSFHSTSISVYGELNFWVLLSLGYTGSMTNRCVCATVLHHTVLPRAFPFCVLMSHIYPNECLSPLKFCILRAAHLNNGFAILDLNS